MSRGSPVVAWCCLLFTWDGKPPCSTDYLHTAPASTPGLFSYGTVSVYIIHSAVPVVFLNFNRVQLVSKMVENVYVVTHKPKLTLINVYKWFDSGSSGKPGHLSFLMCFSNKTTFCFCFYFFCFFSWINRTADHSSTTKHTFTSYRYSNHESQSVIQIRCCCWVYFD